MSNITHPEISGFDPHGALTPAFMYHLFPLGAAACPRKRADDEPEVPRLRALFPYLDHAQSLGCDTLLLGPVFESDSHGYDLSSYSRVDPRLGTERDLSDFCWAAGEKGLKVMFDAVCNHSGTSFYAFKDIQTHGQSSAYVDWYRDLHFDQEGHLSDWKGWNGHKSLPHYNPKNDQVRAMLRDALRAWIKNYGIAGIRFDAADAVDMSLLKELSELGRSLTPRFWTVGEVVHGHYQRWIDEGSLSSVTNYALYKGLHSSANTGNCFEVAHTLEEQFGDKGVCKTFQPQTFLDNHDVPRIASILTNPILQHVLYGLVFTVQGVPSLYYGSEWGLQGTKAPDHDWDLRPALLPSDSGRALDPQIADSIRRLLSLRISLPALVLGTYKTVCVCAKQFAFLRTWNGQSALVLVNFDTACTGFEGWVDDRGLDHAPELLGIWRDALNGGQVEIKDSISKTVLFPAWLRVLVRD